MKAKLLFLTMCLCVYAQAQPQPKYIPKDPQFLRHPGWNIGVGGDYVNGVGTRTGVHAAGIGLRIGRVLTEEHGKGWVRGTFEYDVDVIPAEIYHLPAYKPLSSPVPLSARNYYTGGLNPFVAKWNFTNCAGHAVVPYLAAEGGVLFSNGNLPQGDTSNINFTSGAAFGLQLSSWSAQAKVFHLSNASIGIHNPGVNASVEFRIGYTWFK